MRNRGSAALPPSMKHHTLLLPLDLPCLTDKAATQLVALLHELVAGIEHHYAVQIDRFQRRECERRFARQVQPSMSDDSPF